MMTVPIGLLVPDTVVWLEPLKKVTAISSHWYAELMSSMGSGNDDKQDFLISASVETFPLCSPEQSPNNALIAFKVAVFPKF